MVKLRFWNNIQARIILRKFLYYFAIYPQKNSTKLYLTGHDIWHIE